MTRAAEVSRAPTRRFVHLGDRLLAIGRIRAGALDVARAAEDLGVTADDVRHWLQVHVNERVVTFDELRETQPPELLRLARRVQRLADLVAQAERMVRDLHQEFTSKKSGENPHLQALRVVRAQPSGD